MGGISYSINIEIDNVDFVEIDEDKIENYRKELKENILTTLTTRIVNNVGEIKLFLMKNSN
jgi:hypothetical protein